MDQHPEFWFIPALAFSAIFIIVNYMVPFAPVLAERPQPLISGKIISDVVKRGETLFIIFKRHGLDIETLFKMKEASASVHEIRAISEGQGYTICLDEANYVKSLTYRIDDNSLLKIERKRNGYQAERLAVPYETRTLTVSGTIGSNLIGSVGEDRESFLLAMKFAGIFESEIDFTSDLQPGDSYSVVVEGLFLNGEFRKYGEILSAQLVNDGARHAAYRFDAGGGSEYFDSQGKSLRKSFLKAPLSYSRISSYFSRKRFHPVLRIYRPHHGVDYAAATGTPVSATGDGTVSFAGVKGQYGKFVMVDHPRGYTTCYGHLSRISPEIQAGSRVKQGDIVGFVGSTGLASGPHLHYEVRSKGAFINPLAMKGEGSTEIPLYLIPRFRMLAVRMDRMLAANEKGGQSPAETPQVLVSYALRLCLL